MFLPGEVYQVVEATGTGSPLGPATCSFPGQDSKSLMDQSPAISHVFHRAKLMGRRETSNPQLHLTLLSSGRHRERSQPSTPTGSTNHRSKTAGEGGGHLVQRSTHLCLRSHTGVAGFTSQLQLPTAASSQIASLGSSIWAPVTDTGYLDCVPGSWL